MQLFPRGSDTVDLIVNWMKNNYSTHGPHCNLFSIFQPIYFFDEIIFNLMQDISDKWLNKYDSLMDSHYFRMHEIKFVKLIEVFSINTIKSVNVQMIVGQSHNESKSKRKAKAINMLKLAPKISTKYLWAFDTKTDLCLFRWTEVMVMNLVCLTLRCSN